ncbi:hypothetical protein H7K62_12955 [Quadrisphaera sp. RL12-1S]|uniref:DUF6414 family protein n=1 Tax=Quadrisphaera sp. RL12-1S TaxID=2763011 RepID=UPI00164503C9|nr:hypothetical protein [Quadrisphaera sp. RL12-1S]MBC3762603.1 hypothetical protein [Quadrisphaera sp. RL12-1S]
MAARHGSVIETLKSTITDTTTSEVGSSLSTPAAAGLPSAGLTSKNSSANSSAREVVRRAVIQGTFRDLRLEDAGLKISVDDHKKDGDFPAMRTVKDLSHHLRGMAKVRRAVRVADLVRGDVIEARVELRAERTYQLATAITSTVDMLSERPGAFGVGEQSLAEATPIVGLLSRLLVDLVPLAARMTSHRLVDCEGEAWLIDADVIAKGSELDLECQYATIAGVTEASLYWKDVRRLLFDGSEYSIYARLAKPGLAQNWSPVKLANVLESISPELGEQLRQISNVFDGAQYSPVDESPVEISAILMEDGLLPFGRSLTQGRGQTVSETSLTFVAASAASTFGDVTDLEDISRVREAYDAVLQFIEESAPTATDRVDRTWVQLLRDAHHQAVLLAVSSATSKNTATAVPLPAPQNFLEVEVTAIYW